MKDLVEEIIWLCCQFGVYRVERREECARIREELVCKCRLSKVGMNISEPGLLLALLDAYEITRDEAMLQEVLDVVSGNLEQLEVSAASVKLLAYCYYYVEEEECAERAGKMLEELKRRGVDEEELAEVGKVLEELTGNF